MTDLEKIVSLCKRRGFIYSSSEIYGGLAGAWDYGPYGLALKQNIKNLWWKRFVDSKDEMYGMDASILMNPRVWQASGHISGFSDPLSDCEDCKKRFRTDALEKRVCPECGGKLGASRQFNMMFETKIGAMEDSSATVYLRPETAQGMFVNFKNIVDSFHPKIPFGIAQIGKAFRNEITPRDFIFRTREFEQMEIEYFVKESEWKDSFEYWRKEMLGWMSDIGLSKKSIHELEVPDDERAHYSKRTIDFEFDYPFGRKELYGLAYRTDFDLSAHSSESTVDLSYYDEETKERFIPNVIEPSFGVDRTVLAVLLSAYTEDELGGAKPDHDNPVARTAKGGSREKRVYLKLKPSLAPVKVAVFPLLKNKPELMEKAREVYAMLKKEIPQIAFDDNGNIGKRYRRQDEIGTPFCVTIDFETLDNDTVTIRYRDDGRQERSKISEISSFITEKLKTN
ncbi:MAG: glycine--tRNA ligase [Patescibacteria group bacterium]